MDFDHSYNGSAAWSFPSPGATPTNASFDSNVFQTPKTAAYHPSHFQDAFTTPHIPSYATPQQAEYASMISMQRPHTSTGTIPSNIYGNGHSFGGHVSGPGMLPLTQAGGYPSIGASHILESHASKGPMQPLAPTSFESSQMQTPPPTRGATSRQVVPSQYASFGTPSTIASRRLMTPHQGMMPDQSSQMYQQMPVSFPQLQFSPDAYQFGNLGPASAPVQSPSQVLWAQHSSVDMPYQQHLLADPFAPTSNETMTWPSGHVSIYHPTPSFDTPAMASFPIMQPQPRSASAVPFVPSSAPVPSSEVSLAGVDPSLLYSSPTRRDAEPALLTAGNGAMRADASRNASVAGANKRPSMLASNDNPSSSAFNKLTRSNTVGPSRPSSTGASIGAASSRPLRNHSMKEPPRTVSPLKRVGMAPSLGTMSETKKPRQRSSIVLTVDEHGRARTENKAREDSLTTNAREKYPGIFDSDSSDAESDTTERPSRNSSFSFSKSQERRSKAARLDSPVENLEGLSILRSSSSASNKVPPSRAVIAAAAQLRRVSSLKRRSSYRDGQRRAASFATVARNDSTAEVSPERLSVHELSSKPTLDDHNRRWSVMSMEARRASQSASPQDLSEEFPPAAGLAHLR